MSNLKWMLVSVPDENGDVKFELQGDDGNVTFNVRGYAAAMVAHAIVDAEYKGGDDARPIH